MSNHNNPRRKGRRRTERPVPHYDRRKNGSHATPEEAAHHRMPAPVTYVRRPGTVVWHVVKPVTAWSKRDHAVWHPHDEHLSRCNSGAFYKRADGVAVMKADVAETRTRPPRGARVCKACKRKVVVP